MVTDITHVTVLVEDQDEALEFYRDTLGLVVRDDETMEMEGTEMRWLTVSPADSEFPQVALMPAASHEARERVGSQVGDEVALVFATDDFDADYDRLREAGVRFHGDPTENPWGREAIFEDPYGNRHDLLEPADPMDVAA